MDKKQYLGLDIGTNSTGFALTDQNYKVIHKNGKALWGVHLFPDAKTQKTRRLKRSNRRRLERRRQRINLLQELMAEEINKVDSNFYAKLNSSFCKIDDKDNKIKYNLFAAKDFTDKDYYKKYKTIYHLRSALLSEDKKFDIRLVYLALHHLIKYRGHFTFEGQNFSLNDLTFKDLFERLDEFLIDEPERIYLADEVKFNEMIRETRGINDTQKMMVEFFDVKCKRTTEIISLISGKRVKSNILFANDEYKNLSKLASFSLGDDYNEKIEPELDETFGDDGEIIRICKEIYDLIFLRRILNKDKFLATAMVRRYEKHANDLKTLKEYVLANNKEVYSDIFRKFQKTDNKKIIELNSYPRYIGSNLIKKEKVTVSLCKPKDFYDYLKNILKICPGVSPYFDRILADMENNNYLPRLNSSMNGVFPFQLNEIEITEILKKQAKYYPFLLNEDKYGSVKDKIISLLTFKIPYYVGPLNTHSKFAWLERKNGKIYPWNFSEVVDLDKTATNFITSMTNKCTYLRNNDTLPKNSIIYSEFMLLNQINTWTINGEKISYEVKMDLIDNLFKKQKSVNVKKITAYLQRKYSMPIQLATANNKKIEEFSGDLNSYITFSKIFPTDVDEKLDIIEDIIREITLFEDKSILEKRLDKIYHLSSEQIKQIKPLSYKKWGKFSKELLVVLKSKVVDELGEVKEKTILDILRETNLTFMEIIWSSKYSFKKLIDDKNSLDEKINYEYVDNLPTSPANKRGIWRVLKIVKELEKITKKPIDKFFVECNRGDEKNKETKDSRKKNLEKAYQGCKKVIEEIDGLSKKDYEELMANLSLKDNRSLRSKKLYLYFTQFGRCMYSLEPININALFTSEYDIDHIIPQSMLKDDSMDNLVLVKRTLNDQKSDSYPIPAHILNTGCVSFWTFLKKNGLITEKKLAKLTRKIPLNDEELTAFINRQLVFTSQTIKHVNNILLKLYPNAQVVWSKASNVTDFRNSEQLNFHKCRETNDFHHAHDAYLNVVVGNVLNAKFGQYVTSLDIQRIKEKKQSTNIKKVFDYPVYNLKKELVWNNYEILATVKKQLSHQDMMVTFMQTVNKGELFNQTITSYKKTQNLFPLKNSGHLSNIEYGGYTSINPSYYCIVETKIKNKIKYKFVSIPIYVAINKNLSEEDYLRSKFGDEDFKVIVNHIPNGMIIQSETGFEVRITGTTDRANSTQVKWDKKSEDYLKNVLKVGELNINDEMDEFILHDSAEVEKRQVVSKENNLKLYETVIQVFSKNIFKDTYLEKLRDIMVEKKETFVSLTLKNQCLLLKNLFIVQETKSKQVDIGLLLGGKKDFGRITSTVIKKGDKLISRSITGYYEVVIWECK